MKLPRRVPALVGWMALLALLALLAGGAAWVLRLADPVPSERVTLSPRAAAPAAAAPASAAQPVDAAAPASSAASSPASAPGRSSVQAVAKAAPAVEPIWDLCGLGRMPKPRDVVARGAAAELPAHLGAQASEAALRRMVAALSTGHDRQRAAARLLRRALKSPPQDQPPAPAGEGNNDPVVLSWKLRSCGHADGRCLAADALRWVQIEPENAAAWLAVAALVPARSDEALQRMAQALQFSNHFGKLMQTAMQFWPADVPSYVQVDLWLRVANVEAALTPFGIHALYRHCTPAPPAGSERQAQCARLATVVGERSDTLTAERVGLRLAALSGTPPAVVAASQRALDELATAARLPLDGRQPYSCQSVDAVKAWLAARGNMGEVQSLRAAAVQPR